MKKISLVKKIAFFSVLLIGILALAYRFYLPNYLIERAVKSYLNDPDSAKFSRVSFNRENGFGCGLVNSKNRMGGYVGNKYFLAHVSGTAVFELNDAPTHYPDEKRLEIMKAQLELLEKMKANCAKL